jgi:Arc/MetJ family transcription regulator
MATNLAIDDKLLIKAQKISGLKTKKETVSIALKEFIQRRKQEEIIELFGTVDYGNYDYKKHRTK